MKGKMMIIGVALTLVLVVIGGYFALKIFLPGIFLSNTTLANDLIITSEPTEINENKLLRVTKEQQYVAIVLEKGYEADPPRGIKTPDGDLVILEIKLVDENRDEFPLIFDSSLARSAYRNEVAEFAYLSGYNTLPVGKTFQKVILKSNIPIKVKSVLWSGYDSKDTK